MKKFPNLHPELRHSSVSTSLVTRNDAPELIGCVAAALDYIKVVRETVYPSPRLVGAGNDQGGDDKDTKRKEGAGKNDQGARVM